jgi:CubicO group peptidase (beta-lactamase class C family)
LALKVVKRRTRDLEPEGETSMESFVAYHGVDASTHQQRFDELLAQGLRMTWINVSGDPSDARYAAIWVASDGRAWAGLHNLDAAGYQQRFNELTAAGLTPSVVSAAGPADRAVLAAMFEQRDVGSWTARHGLPWGASGQPDTMVGQSEQAYAAGQVPRCLAVYGDANDRRYAGIWWEARDGVSASWWLGDGDFYQRLFDAQVAGGNRPSSLAVSDDGSVLSVFRGDQIGAWTARHRISSQEYQAEFDRQLQQDHRPIVVAAGGSGDSAQYAAIFASQETAVPRVWTVTVDSPGPDALAAELDAAMADTMSRFGVRAAALAVARNGVVLVSRGYTWAETWYPVTQPAALFRLASVSKIFTSAAAQALHDDNILNLDTPMFGFLGTTTPVPVDVSVDPRVAQITSRHAATRITGMHRDLFGHRPDGTFGDATMRDVSLLLAGHLGPPALDDVVRYVYGMELVSDPGTMSPIDNGYSNIAFFVLGAAVQQAARQPIDAYIRQRLLAPLGVSDFFVARTAVGQRLAGEVSGYDSANAGPSMLDTTGPWAPGAYGGSFVLEVAPGAGGFATSVATVARFIGSHAVWDLGPRIINTRYGDFDGTGTIAQSRDSGLDLAVSFNFWVPDTAKGQLLARIGPVLDAAGL